jgi:hypothetical protein
LDQTRRGIERGERTLEGKVQRLRGEVTDDVGGVATPEGENTFFPGGTAEAFNDTIVTLGKTSRLHSTWLAMPRQLLLEYLHHFILILDEELDSLDGGCQSVTLFVSEQLSAHTSSSLDPISLALSSTECKHERIVGEEQHTLATAAETPPTTQKSQF